MAQTLQQKLEEERKRRAAAAAKKKKAATKTDSFSLPDPVKAGLQQMIKPYVEGYQAGGIPGLIGGAGRDVLGLGHRVQDILIDDPALGLEQFAGQVAAGFRGKKPEADAVTLAEPKDQLPSLAPKPKPEPKAKVAPSKLSFTAPFVSAPKRTGTVPTVPDIQGALAAFEKGAPKKADPIDRLAYIFQAIAGVGIDPNSSIGINLLRVGMASLGGLGAFKEAEAGAEAAFQDEMQAYNLQQAQAQQSLAQQQFSNRLAAQGLLGEQEQAAFQGQAFEAEQLQPSVKGGFLLQPELGEAGKQVTTTLTELPKKGSETAAMVQKLIAQQAMLNPQATYGALQSTPKGSAAIDWAAEQLELPRQGLGIEWSDEDKGKIAQYIQTNEKELFNETVMPYLDLTAGIQALGKRPIK